MFSRSARLTASILVCLAGLTADAGSVKIANHPTRSVVFGLSPRTALAPPKQFYFSLAYNAEFNKLVQDGFQPLTTEWGTPLYSDVRFLVKSDLLAPSFSERFLSVLERQKLNLMKIYYLSDDEYNRLALLAFGVAAQESKLGRSLKYVLKENAQFAVTWMKEFRAWREGRDYDGDNSRGPTQ
ncbi:MAG: hypothetical protein AAB250_04135, partial [Bdellovibrionota bacterium]